MTNNTKPEEDPGKSVEEDQSPLTTTEEETQPWDLNMGAERGTPITAGPWDLRMGAERGTLPEDDDRNDEDP